MWINKLVYMEYMQDSEKNSLNEMRSKLMEKTNFPQ